MDTAQLLLRGLGGLIAVLGTVWVCARLVRARAGALGATPSVRLRVLARASLGRHSSVVTVDVGDRLLVLGVGEHGVRLLAEQPALPAPEQPAERVEVDLSGAVGEPATVGAPAAPGAPGAPGPAVPAPRSAVAGSLVDPAVWRAVVAVARDKTVRR